MSEKNKLKTIDIILPAVCAAIITVCSWIYIPSTVPFTMQTFAIFLITGLFGAKYSEIAIFLYILLGFIGLPVFSGFKSGWQAVAGPTGGYMVGFFFIPLVYAVFTRLFSKSAVIEFISFITGLIICYAFGTAWFMFVFSRHDSIGIIKTLSLCVFPFIIPDVIKLSLALFITKRLSLVIKTEK